MMGRVRSLRALSFCRAGPIMRSRVRHSVPSGCRIDPWPALGESRERGFVVTGPSARLARGDAHGRTHFHGSRSRSNMALASRRNLAAVGPRPRPDGRTFRATSSTPSVGCSTAWSANVETICACSMVSSAARRNSCFGTARIVPRRFSVAREFELDRSTGK